MKREVLTPLECLETVDGDFGHRVDSFELAGLQKQAMAAQTSDVMRDRSGAAIQSACDLAVGHAAHDHHDNARRQFGTLLPVRRRERLRTKVTVTGKTCKPLDTLRA
jgi:hypothetical protein